MEFQPNPQLVKLRPVDESDVDNILTEKLAWVRKMRTSADDRVYTVLSADDRSLGPVGLHQIF